MEAKLEKQNFGPDQDPKASRNSQAQVWGKLQHWNNSAAANQTTSGKLFLKNERLIHTR